jgi:hypothetical protein
MKSIKMKLSAVFLSSFVVACSLSIVQAGTLTSASVSLSNHFTAHRVGFSVNFTTATAIADFKVISVTGVNFKLPSGSVMQQISCSNDHPSTALATQLSPNVLKISTFITGQSIDANTVIHCTWSENEQSTLTNSLTPQPATTVSIATYEAGNALVDSVSGVFFPEIIDQPVTTEAAAASTSEAVPATTQHVPATTEPVASQTTSASSTTIPATSASNPTSASTVYPGYTTATKATSASAAIVPVFAAVVAIAAAFV